MQNRITALTAINGELDDLTRRREAILQWSAELRSTVGELKQRKARLRPEAAQHDLTQVRHHSYYLAAIVVEFKMHCCDLPVDGYEAIDC